MPLSQLSCSVFESIAASLASSLGGEVVWLEDDALALAIEGRQRVLLRNHPREVGISLPREKSWTARSVEDAAGFVKALRASLKPPVVTIGEVCIVLRLLLGERPAWRLSFPGTPVPNEGWLRRDDASIGLFQHDRTVRIVIWVGRSAVEQVVARADEVNAAFVADALARQAQWVAEDKAERAREAALPKPTVEKVIAALEAGARVQTNGGRAHDTWFWNEGLYAEVFDEGDAYTANRTEEQLALSISVWPAPFRAALAVRTK